MSGVATIFEAMVLDITWNREPTPFGRVLRVLARGCRRWGVLDLGVPDLTIGPVLKVITEPVWRIGPVRVPAVVQFRVVWDPDPDLGECVWITRLDVPWFARRLGIARELVARTVADNPDRTVIVRNPTWDGMECYRRMEVEFPGRFVIVAPDVVADYEAARPQLIRDGVVVPGR